MENKNQIILWVDDERPMPQGYTHHAWTYDQAIEFLNTGNVVAISLDHDLGGDDPTLDGHNIAKQILHNAYWNNLQFMVCQTHSGNPVGSKNILATLWDCYRIWDEDVLEPTRVQYIEITHGRDPLIKNLKWRQESMNVVTPTVEQPKKAFAFPADVRYHHIRVFDTKRYFGGPRHELSATGGATLAYYIDHEKNQLSFAIARCHELDRFDRKIGREKSLVRLSAYLNGEEQVDSVGRILAFTIDSLDISQNIAQSMFQAMRSSIMAHTRRNFRDEIAAQMEADFDAQKFDITEPMPIGDLRVSMLIDRMCDIYDEVFPEKD